ncbi:FABP family protein [Actinomyces lilanjuaniae]|uniref:FABP family protein n=1 Tax=Actinomyces lilanjuaniae TaxID=2321394 RepID=A0ABN5PRJ4_9ACTO|nr:FABP family protein [Actinomyces lilanjuaniae]AYD89196.1 FABP family protein [Actinomyces lilanjuaniae]
MAFTFPDGLAPELYPLAWLVGGWRGYGVLTYGETVPEQAVYQEMVFDHDGGPYLRQRTTIWTVDATRSQDLDFEMPGLEGGDRLAPAQVWSTETAYWRPVAQEEPDPDDADTRTPVTRLELVSADPAGHVAVWEGWIQGPRAQVASQAVGRSRTAAAVTQMSRMVGLVGGDLMWTQDMAAFGVEELTTYASGRLGRVAEPDAPPSDPAAPASAPGGRGVGLEDAAAQGAGAGSAGPEGGGRGRTS